MSSRPLSSRLQRISKYPAARAGLIEHRLIGEVSPMVALAMTIPAGAKYSAGDGDYGQVAAAYKHVLLRVKIEIIIQRFDVLNILILILILIPCNF